MNLQEALNYRTTCLIHHKSILPFTYRANATFINKEGNLELKIRYSRDTKTFSTLIFQQDGKIISQPYIGRSSAIDWMESSAIDWMELPLTIFMRCEECGSLNTNYDEGKTIDLGPSTLRNVKSISHLYTVIISGNESDFTCNLGNEIVRYNVDNKFYHLNANLVDGSAQFRMGSCNGQDTVQQLSDTLMRLDVPQFDPLTITSIDQMINKIKIYNLFG